MSENSTDPTIFSCTIFSPTRFLFANVRKTGATFTGTIQIYPVTVGPNSIFTEATVNIEKIGTNPATMIREILDSAQSLINEIEAATLTTTTP